MVPVVLLLWLSAGSTAMGQDWAKRMFNHTKHDFGVVARGAKAEHGFTFENIYLEDAHIVAVRSSCGCTTMQYPKEILKTYQTARIVVKMDTRSFLGRKDSTLTVVFDKPFPAEVQLHVYSFIRRDVVLQPGSVQFGSVGQGRTVRRKTTVSYAGRNDWRILDVKSANPHLKIDVIEVGRSRGRVTYDLVMTLDGDAPPGYVNEQVIMTTDDPNPRKARVPVTVEGIVVPAISVRPSPLMLGVLQEGRSVSKNLVVHGKEPFRILGVSCNDKRFRFAAPKDAKTFHLIPVTFTAESTPGEVNAAIRIQTDREQGKELEVTAHAEIVRADSTD
jgi:hypothetical protein